MARLRQKYECRMGDGRAPFRRKIRLAPRLLILKIVHGTPARTPCARSDCPSPAACKPVEAFQVRGDVQPLPARRRRRAHILIGFLEHSDGRQGGNHVGEPDGAVQPRHILGCNLISNYCTLERARARARVFVLCVSIYI